MKLNQAMKQRVNKIVLYSSYYGSIEQKRNSVYNEECILVLQIALRKVKRQKRLTEVEQSIKRIEKRIRDLESILPK